MADNFNFNDPDFIAKVDEALKKVGKTIVDNTNKYEGFNDSAREYLSLTKKSIDIQANMRKSLDGLLGGLKKIKDIEGQINDLSKQAAIAQGENRDIILEEIKGLRESQKLYQDNYKAVNKTGLALKESAKLVASIPKGLKNAFGKLKSEGIFDMDKAIKSSALNMGLLKNQSNAFYKSIASASNEVTAMGGSVEDMAKAQAEYSEELGRAVMLGKDGLIAVTQIAKGTGIGAEAAAKMAAEFSNQGLSAEKTRDYIEQTMNDASKMGLNASKVIKSIAGNIKLLNRYNFKNGIKGLEEMALTAAKLGVNIDMAAPMADKLWNIEGAVDMSAQLQVMGGKFAALADPFKLMYMARNDVEGLTTALGEAASESMHFAKDGSIQTSTYEMSRLKKVAEETGVSYDELINAGKTVKALSTIKKQVFGVDPAMRDFIANTAKFSQNGKATIEINSAPKLVSQLNDADKSIIKAKMDEKASLEKRAKDAMSFDEQIRVLVDQFKTYLLPFVKSLAENGGAFDRVRKWFDKEKIGERLEKLGKYISDKIGGLLDWVSKNPYTAIGAYLGTQLLGALANNAQWIANGLALAEGFNMGTGGGGGGGIMKMIKGLFSKGGAAATAAEGAAGAGAAEGAAGAGAGGGAAAGGAGSAAAGVAGKLAGGLAIAGALKDEFDFFSDKKTRDTGGGGWLESLGGSGLSLIDWIPGLNQLTEAAGLGINGMGTDDVANARAIYRKNHPDAPTSIPNKILIADIKKNPEDYTDAIVGGAKNVDITDLNDGIIKFNPNDKFMAMNDGMIAGTSANNNIALARSMQSNALSNNLDVKHSPLQINGAISLSINGQSSNAIGSLLLNDPSFISNLSAMVNKATASAVAGKTN